MSYIFFDTETNGLPEDFKVGAHTYPESWPELVQLAWIVTDDDMNVLSQHSYIIKPDGWRIAKTSSEIHGISQKQATEQGEHLEEVLTLFQEDYVKSELAVSHNLEFDENIMVAAFHRAGMKSPMKKVDRLCTMRTTAQYVGIENNWGKYKWPKLGELYIRVLGKKFNETHQADQDVKALVELYAVLKNDSEFKRPEPYFVPVRRMAMRFYKDISVPRKPRAPKKRITGDNPKKKDDPSGCGTTIIVIIIIMVIAYLLVM